MKDYMKKNFDFKNPPTEYGEVAFFWWHGDDVTKEKLKWILEQLKDKHVCGLQINYCHTNKGGMISGLTMESNPKLFSDEWWELVRWFVSECKKYDITVSLSDYTLGAPGQGWYTDEVIKNHPEMLGQLLVMNDSGEIEVIKRNCSLNPMAINSGKEIINEFYGKFEQNIPGECGKGINFFFSDELCFNVSGKLWCDDFKEEFIKRKGYDITEKWQAIFKDTGPETPKIRLDYYDVIVQLSEERYFKVVYDWHEERGMTFGCDHGGRGADITEFGDYFRTMKWNQGPGNDQPCLSSNVIKTKVNASIAHMYKRPRVWLEGFHSSGWAVDSSDVADAIFRNFALGHNLLSLHGLYYSTHGSMWEWAPPCNHHHMPYWEQMGKLLHCTKRLSYLISQGVHCCDVAIVYPVAAMEADKEQGQAAKNTAFEVGKYLYSNGVDFDFIDFESIQNAEINNGELCISGESFKTIIVPEMDAVRYGMMEKLYDFAKSGGQVIFKNCLPTASDRIGRNDDKLDNLVKSILNTGCLVYTIEDVLEKIKENTILDFSCDTTSPFFQHRKINDEDYYILYRIPRDKSVQLRAKGYPVILDPWTGNKYQLNEYSCSEIQHNKGYDSVTSFNMPVMEREILILMFESDKDTFLSLPKYTPISNNDEVITMNGVWKSQIIPTMNNIYGDWRLPAFDGFIGPEAREMEYCYCDQINEIPDNVEWKKSLYSYGTHFWFAEGNVDESKLIAAESPIDEMREYRFSMKYGVEGDAGEQNSFHGLKGILSDEFLVMGEKVIPYASASKYVGEGPFYFFTTVSVDCDTTVQIETGKFKPDCVWIDHKVVSDDKVVLCKGRHYILLRFPCGGRSYFVLKKKNAFVQTRPLVTNWFNNTDILTFDAIPKQRDGYCCYKFMSPPGAVKMKISATSQVTAYIDGEELISTGENEFKIPNNKMQSTEITLFAKQLPGCYDTALITEPITFDVEFGEYDIEKSYDSQGLSFYSGGISLKKEITIEKNSSRKFFQAKAEMGASVEVYVNGEMVDVLLTKPYCCEITDYLKDGKNEIEVRAFNDLHNHMKSIPTDYNKKICVE